MMRFIKKVICFAACIIFCIYKCIAQSGQPPIKYIGIENGLSNNVVNSLYLDKYGFMWMGTNDGLNRYDGYNFRVFRNQWGNENSLINNHITALNGDSSDRVWIGTQKGISFFNYANSRISPILYQDKDGRKKITSPVNATVVSAANSVFIATNEKGLFLVKDKKLIAKRISYAKNSNYTVQALTMDGKQDLWLFIKDAGLCFYTEKQGRISLINNQLHSATSLLKDHTNHILWIGTENGLYSYSSDKVLKRFPFKLSNENVMGLMLDKSGLLWIATDGGGITLFNEKDKKVSYIPAGKDKGLLSSGSIGAVYEDRESRKWIATLRGGVNVIDDKNTQFKTIKNDPFQKNSLVNNFVLSFCEDTDKNIWIGTDGGGLSCWNPRLNTYTNYVRSIDQPNSLTSNFVTSILKDHEHKIWIATFSGGIDRFDKSTGQFKHYTCYNTVRGIDEINLWKLYEDRQQNLWAGTTKSGALYKLNRLKDKFELFDEKLKDIHTIYQDRENTLWAGNYTHLIKVDVKTKRHEFIPVNFAIRAIHEDVYHNLWIGTEGGGLLLYDRKAKKFKRYIESDGLPSNSILNILEDNKGNLWCSTYNGLSKFNSKTNKFKNYFATDGLQSNQFNYNAACKLSNGEFLFGGINGFNKFFPDSIKINKRIPKIVLTDFRINNISIDADPKYKDEASIVNLHQLSIPYNSAVISVDFAAIEFSFQDQITYAYYLEGWDRGWNNVGKLKTAYYSRLNEGSYKLHIKSTDTEGGWSNNEKVISIVILPPWYRTWWAYTLYFLAFSGLYYIFWLYRNRQSRLKHEVEIANLKMEREKDLNEKKLNFFTNISHELRTPLTLIVNPIKDILNQKESGQEKNDLNIVYRNSRRLLSLVDQLLLFRKTESEIEPLKIVSFNLSKFAKDIFLCFSYLAKNNTIAYDFICEQDDIEIYADKDKLEIVLFNLLSNALKFTPKGGFVSLKINLRDEMVQFQVTDSGSGIPDDIGEKLFDKFYKVQNNKSLKIGFGIGLYLVKSFVELHRGKISYSSTVTEGTTFSVEMPVGQVQQCTFSNHAASDELTYVNELIVTEEEAAENEVEKVENLELLISDVNAILLVDDNKEIIEYMRQIFQDKFKIYEAFNGIDGLARSHEFLPDIIISDVNMDGLNGIDFCKAIKEDPFLSHIPVILLTADPTPELKLKGIEVGAYDFISKPFDKDLFTAKINSVIKNRSNLQSYFFKEITLKSDTLKVSEEDRGFLEKCIALIEENLMETAFNVKIMASALGMSHSNLYKKIKATSGQSINSFMRFIRLRKSAELLINTNLNINEVAYRVGFNDIKYFREQFQKLFKLTPSEFVKKHRNNFHKYYNVNSVLKP